MTGTPERGAAPPGVPASALDIADIKPLDVPAALQILIAEVRESLVSVLIEAGDAGVLGKNDSSGGSAAWPTAHVDTPTSAARVLVEMLLHALPDSADEAAWEAALPRLEAALQSGLQRAMDVVSGWRDVSTSVVQMSREAAGLVLQVLGDEPQNPLWLGPEWLTMTPRLTRFWRRRRIWRRRLTDPDHDTNTRWDENDGYTP